ncbi:MAG: hypothetical protein WC423_19920 [Vulcanimicrobiota bacterium]
MAALLGTMSLSTMINTRLNGEERIIVGLGERTALTSLMLDWNLSGG